MKRTVILVFSIFLSLVTINISQADLWDGIVHVWTFDENTSNSNLGDYVGNWNMTSNHNSNVMSNSTSIDGNSWYFTQDYANGTYDLSDYPSGSVNIWVYVIGSATPYDRIFEYRQSASERWGMNYEVDEWDFNFNYPGTVSFKWGSASANSWYMLTAVYNSSSDYPIQLYQNGVKTKNDSTLAWWNELASGGSLSFGWDVGTPACSFIGLIDEAYMWDRPLSQSEISELYNSGSGTFYSCGYDPINITDIYCKSSDILSEGYTQPYRTSDVTPTFNLTTVVDAWCKISDENLSWDGMGNMRNCSDGEGQKSHNCTLSLDDELVEQYDYVYISCAANDRTNNLTIRLPMNITNLVENRTNAIDGGIQASSIWPQAYVYEDQKVFLRDLNNNQVLATVDRVVVYGNHRWIFNYEESGALGLFNISPVVYVRDFEGQITFSEIESQVTSLIDSTVS